MKKHALGALTPDYVVKSSADTLAPQLEEMHEGVYANPAMTAYVAGVAEGTKKFIPRSADKHTYKILNSTKIVNAFTLGNGNIYVTRGLLNLLDDEAQLAEVVGHENGHYGLNHIGAQMDRAIGTNAILGVAEAVFMALKGDKLNDQNKAAIDQVNALIPGLILNGYGRDQELEADGQGLQSMIQAGYDPAGAIGVFQTFQKMEPEVKGIQVFMQSHPTAKTRIADLQQQINTQFPGTIGTGERFADRYQEMVKGTLAKEVAKGDTVISPILIAGGVLTAAAVVVLVLTL